MLRDGYNVQFEGTVVRTAEEPRLLRESNVQPDQGWSWIVLFAAFLSLFITNGMHASFGILYAALISHFNSGREETAWIGSISLGMLCFFSPVASVLIEQIGCRATSIIGAFLCSLGFLITSFAASLALLYFSHGLLFGLGTSLTYTAAMTVVTRSFERRRNIATGFCTSGSQFGGISLAPLSQVLFDRLGYANAFRTFAALMLVVAISSLVYRSELSRNTSRPTSAKKSPKEMLNVWKSKPYIVWVLGTTIVTLGYNIPRYTLAKYASDQGISKDASAWLLSYLCASSAIGRITFGRLCEWIPKLYLCQACIIGCAVSAFVFPFLKSYLALVITAIIFGLPDGAFVASLSMVTTEIVGPEKMVEGFGFMLFCHSYSNVIGPPLSGMLYDTYQSYKPAFCFAAVPEIIGALMLFLIPYYRRSQVNYTHEIGYISNSGILNTSGVASTLNPISEAPILPAEESHGEYNVVINLTSNNPDVRFVNMVIQKAGSNGTTGVTCNEGEVAGTVMQDNGIVNKAVVDIETPVCAGEIPVYSTEAVSVVEQSSAVARAASISNEPEVNTLSDVCPMKSSSIQTVIHDCTNNSTQTMNELHHHILPSAALTSQTSTATSCRENEMAEVTDIHISAPVHAIPSTQLVDVVSNDAQIDEERQSYETTDIMNLGLQVKSSNTSLHLDTNASVIRIASNAVSLSDGHENPVEENVHLQIEHDVPKISPPPPHKHHVNRTEVHHVTNADVRTACNEKVVENSPEAMLAELDTLIQESELAINPCLTAPFSPSKNNQQASLVKCACPGLNALETGLEPGLTGLEKGLTGLEPGLTTLEPLNQNQESLMLSTTFIPEMTTAFSTESSRMSGMNDVLTQKQLPEPMKPTSLSSVRANEQHVNQSQDVPPATSPLSCELSTVIADVIQSLTSQQSASQKSNKESSISSTTADNSQENSETTNNLEKKEVTVVEKSTRKEPKLGINIDPITQASSQLSSNCKLQTSVLHSMQSIVAEGCPEDVALLEDISIDLTLDKDPSFASIVIIDDADEQDTTNDVNFQCLSREQEIFQTSKVSRQEKPHVVRNDAAHEQASIAQQVSHAPQVKTCQEQGFRNIVHEPATTKPVTSNTQDFASGISSQDKQSSHPVHDLVKSSVLSSEILNKPISAHPSIVQTEIFSSVGKGLVTLPGVNPATISAHPFSSDPLHEQSTAVLSERSYQPQAGETLGQEQHLAQSVDPSMVHEPAITAPNVVSNQVSHELTGTHPSVILSQEHEATIAPIHDQCLTSLTHSSGLTPFSVISNAPELAAQQLTHPSVILTQGLPYPNVAQDRNGIQATMTPTPTQPFAGVDIDQNVSSVTTDKVLEDTMVLGLFSLSGDHDGTSYDGTKSYEKLAKPIESTNPFYKDMNQHS